MERGKDSVEGQSFQPIQPIFTVDHYGRNTQPTNACRGNGRYLARGREEKAVQKVSHSNRFNQILLTFDLTLSQSDLPS